MRTKYRPRVELLENWQGPLLAAPDYYAGKAGKLTLRADTERHGNGTVPGIRDKLARRAIRKARAAGMSSVACKIRDARMNRLQTERLASNSHEAKRYVEQLRAAEFRTRQWCRAWSGLWRNVGQSYAKLYQIARQAPLEAT